MKVTHKGKPRAHMTVLTRYPNADPRDVIVTLSAGAKFRKDITTDSVRLKVRAKA